MPKNWTLARIGDISSTNLRTYSLSEKWPYVNYLDTGNVTENRIDQIQRLAMGEDPLPSRARRKVEVGDIIYSTVRPNQRHYGIIKEVLPNMLVSTGFTVISPNIRKVDPDFLYYFLTRNEIVESLHAIGEQSVSAYPSIRPSDIENLEIALPPLPEQIEIGRTLRALDEKIAINTRINNHLEQIAQAIFKSWFVDFEPFQNDEFIDIGTNSIPKDWKLKQIRDLPITVTDFVANGSFASLKKNVNLLDTPDYAFFIRNVDLKAKNFSKYVDEQSYRFLSKSSLFGGEVIISNVGDVGSVFLCPDLSKPMTLGNNMIMLTSSDHKNQNIFFFLLFKHSYGSDLIKSITGGSAQPKFNKTDFRALRVIMPSAIVMDKFLDKVNPLFKQQSSLDLECNYLAELRDALLLRLMSGELSVSGIGGAA